MKLWDRCGSKPVIEVLRSMIDDTQWDLCKGCRADFSNFLKPQDDVQQNDDAPIEGRRKAGRKRTKS